MTLALESAAVGEILQALAAGTLTCDALVRTCLARIEAFDSRGPALRAVIAVNPAALADAAALDRAPADVPGSLHGIPVLVKDNIDVAGLPTTGGSITLAGDVALSDAFVVQRLRAAGAIVLAKTNLTELAITGTSVGSLRGQVRNPYDLTRTPGGSSGGTAAAIAAGYAPLGLGSDTGQSVRSPASACALVGVRPTRGLVSRSGLMPSSPSQDEIGPLARTAADAARLLDVLAGPDPSDPVTERCAGRVVDGHAQALDAATLRGARLGWLTAFHGVEAIHDPVNAVVAAAVEVLRDAGATVIPVAIPDLDALTRDLSLIPFEMAAAIDAWLAARPHAAVRTFAEFAARRDYHPSLRRHIEPCLTTPGPASAAYREQLARRAALRAAVREVLERQHLDALVYPHQRRLAVAIGDEQVERNGVLANSTGLPAVCFPGGWSAPAPHAPLGVPVGLELLGRDWDEPRLLSLVHAWEHHAPTWRLPSSTPPAT
jgi:amidase